MTQEPPTKICSPEPTGRPRLLGVGGFEFDFANRAVTIAAVRVDAVALRCSGSGSDSAGVSFAVIVSSAGGCSHFDALGVDAIASGAGCSTATVGLCDARAASIRATPDSFLDDTGSCVIGLVFLSFIVLAFGALTYDNACSSRQQQAAAAASSTSRAARARPHPWGMGGGGPRA